MSQSNVQVPAQTLYFRTLASTPPPTGIAPTYLSGPVGGRYMYSMGIVYDGLTDAAGYAVRARFPSLAPTDAYPWIAQDRQIFQGANEPNASFVARSIQWLDLWRHAGSSTGVLLAILAQVSPAQPEVFTVSTTGVDPRFATVPYSSWDTYQKGISPFPPGQTNPTPPDHYLTAPANWKWDSVSLPNYATWMYWRKWVVIVSTTNSPWVIPFLVWASGGSLNPAIVADAVYGTKYENQSPASPGTNVPNWGDGVSCWGWAGTAAQASALTLAVKTWKSAGCWYPWIIVSYSAALFDQSLAFGSPNLPDGKWGYAGKIVADTTYGTKYVSARPSVSQCTFIAGPVEMPGPEGLG